MAEPLTADEYAEVRRNVMPRWSGAIPVGLAHRLLATVDAERARADQAEAERDAAYQALRSVERAAMDPVQPGERQRLADVLQIVDNALHGAATGDQP